jgi:hypothetical protein
MWLLLLLLLLLWALGMVAVHMHLLVVNACLAFSAVSLSCSLAQAHMCTHETNSVGCCCCRLLLPVGCCTCMHHQAAQRAAADNNRETEQACSVGLHDGGLPNKSNTPTKAASCKQVAPSITQQQQQQQQQQQ